MLNARAAASALTYRKMKDSPQPCDVDLPCARRVTEEGHEFLCGFQVAGTVESCPKRRRYLELQEEPEKCGEDEDHPGTAQDLVEDQLSP